MICFDNQIIHFVNKVPGCQRINRRIADAKSLATVAVGINAIATVAVTTVSLALEQGKYRDQKKLQKLQKMNQKNNSDFGGTCVLYGT